MFLLVSLNNYTHTHKGEKTTTRRATQIKYGFKASFKAIVLQYHGNRLEVVCTIVMGMAK